MTRAVWLLARIAPIVLAAVATIAFAGGASARNDNHDHDSSDNRDHDSSRVERGFDLAPVHLDLRGKNRKQVGLGSYIVNAQGGCNDCHTCPPYTPDHDPFTGGDGTPNAANYLAGGTPFGPFVSRNITPDDDGKPAGLSRAEFIELMRSGHDPDNPGRVLQVMPWPVYGRMLKSDLSAVYEFLRTIPHAEPSAECVPPPER